MKNKKINKFISIILLLLSVLFPTGSAWAVAVDSISTQTTQQATTDAMNQSFSNLGVNETELKSMITEMNNSRRKVQPPQVSLTFSPSNPTPGQKVTATATPMYFMNTDKDLYFTWYLKTDGCPEASGGLSDEKKSKCDLDDDGDIDVNDYKVKAARLIANNDFEWNKASYSSSSDGDGYNAHWGGDDQKGKNNYCYIHDTKYGDEFPITCDNHLFAEMGDTTHHTGDGSFDASEEKFWHTDPNDPDTADTGNGDEANIAGLGMSSFSWPYSEGDEVGVVVEGISVQPTDKQDSSYKIMFALLKNTCDLDYNNDYPKTTIISTTVTEDAPAPGQTTTVIVKSKEEIYQQTADHAEIITTPITETKVTDSTTGEVISDTSVNGTTSSAFKNIGDNYYVKNIKEVSDLDKCLTKNMVTPAEGGGTKEKMDVQLAYSPEAPMNDPSSSDEGDTVKITSSVTNASQNNYLSYTWQVYKSDNSNPDDWGDPLTKSELTNSTQTSGMGANTLSFRLNFSDTGQFYLKVKLTVKENISNKSVREGYNYIVIPISSSSEKIKAYNTTVSTNAAGNPYVSMGSKELCSSGVDKSICPVVKDQIIGVKVPTGYSDFSWTINGQPFNYTTCFFDGCNLTKQTNVAFFPVLVEPGNQYTVALTATDITTGKKVNLTRYFQVIEPEVKITSADETTCKPNLLGYYIDYDGKKWPDWSKDNFQAIAGEKIKLAADFTGFVPDGKNWGWIVDEVGINSTNAGDYGLEIDTDNNLVMTAPESGQSVTVGISSLYFPDSETKKALNAYWGVSYGGFYETEIGDSVEIKAVDSISASTSANNKSNGKIMASLFSSTPSYIAFLFRIVLTGGLLLFMSGFILSFFPKIKPNDSEFSI